MEAIKDEDTGRMPTVENSDEAPCQAMLDQLRDANTRLPTHCAPPRRRTG